MYKLTYITALIFITALMVTGCKKEGALTASEDEQGYTLPQGYHGYDTTILDLYNKYSAYFLYRFTDKDTYWTPTGWKNATLNSSGTWNTGYGVTRADTNFISSQLALIKKLWLSYYTDKFLVKFLPAKVMLCASVDSLYTTYVFTPTFQAINADKSVGAWFNYDNICVNYGNAGVTAMTSGDSLKFLAKTNLIFIQSIPGRNLSAPTNDFTSVANYNGTFSSQANAYAQGIITIYYNGRSAQLDWNAYMEAMVSRSEANLKKSTANTDMTYMGILNTTKDSNGKIRQRYNIIRNYFITNYGVDLQAIGNAADK
ncbi:hypothetical protein A3860_09135 [Niastella vici]|uniref:Uncharacterized protein n=1 Tax=Niastella vici TaxID=1703345 RepID=A0A1V9FHH3_9BACT|nr:hypothetical protein [Niastella vici]OQP57780.1 hypothetical protein A3860_09135 [Niastella vici]